MPGSPNRRLSLRIIAESPKGGVLEGGRPPRVPFKAEALALFFDGMARSVRMWAESFSGDILSMAAKWFVGLPESRKEFLTSLQSGAKIT